MAGVGEVNGNPKTHPLDYKVETSKSDHLNSNMVEDVEVDP